MHISRYAIKNSSKIKMANCDVKMREKNRFELMSACHKSLENKSQNQMSKSARSSDFTLIFRHLTRKR